MNNTEIIPEEILEKIMTGVAIAGTAKSLGKEAILKANEGNFEEARNLFLEAKKQFVEVHDCHFDFIQKEASGERVDLCLLLIHMEDHIMTTSLFLDTLEDQINLIERIHKIEAKIF
ncbi:PTS lactose/cellobiose transporter subunit IIA [Fusobacterium sp. HC1336]|uniref:PTS lactose/cellobiose transporter subunit IIA n=1 Tax=Fusobacterium sp. HC1336 TaxID=3171169 RepID=UPI003F235556